MRSPENETTGNACDTAAPQNEHQHPSTSRKKYQGKLDKSMLLSPIATLDLLGVRYRRSGQRLECFCPFHKNGAERNPSLMVDVRDGHFRCFTCGAKGGDVIALYRAVTSESFGAALQALGVRHDA
jgi:DNA primase